MSEIISWTSKGGRSVSVEVGATMFTVTVDGKVMGETNDIRESRHCKGVEKLLADAGCSHCLVVNGKPVGVLAEVAPKIFAAQEAAAAAAEAHRYRNLPGVAVLREAIGEAAAHHRAVSRLVANDLMGRSPRPLKHDVDALRQQYPAAAVYLKAEGYTEASNYHKAGAGKRAMELLEDGGSIEEAETILANWVPESAMFD